MLSKFKALLHYPGNNIRDNISDNNNNKKCIKPTRN